MNVLPYIAYNQAHTYTCYMYTCIAMYVHTLQNLVTDYKQISLYVFTDEMHRQNSSDIMHT